MTVEEKDIIKISGSYLHKIYGSSLALPLEEPSTMPKALGFISSVVKWFNFPVVWPELCPPPAQIHMLKP